MTATPGTTSTPTTTTTPATGSTPEQPETPDAPLTVDGQIVVDPLDEWRGVGTGESTEDISRKGSVFLKHRSRALLADLLRPYKKIVWFLILVVVIENAARLAIPSLVRRGIDLGVPPLLEGGSGTILYETVGLMLAAVIVQAFSRVTFLRTSGRIGQQVLLEIRRRTFKHFQKLDVAFHDKYTSGRVVSRL
ncbi:MAG: ABC transporter transmembrane domain-containing protein, partial [Propionibacteriaceae bacterium]